MADIYAIKVLGTGSKGLFATPRWLESGDVEAHDGLGSADLTDDASKAKQFEDPGSAFKFWRQQSVKRPIRSDGQPNRPLTAFTVEILKLILCKSCGHEKQDHFDYDLGAHCTECDWTQMEEHSFVPMNSGTLEL